MIEDRRLVVPATGKKCSYCEGIIRGDGVLIQGRLDDGSPGVFEAYYHPDCSEDMEYDYDETGCFQYGEVVAVGDIKPEPVVVGTESAT